MLRVMIQTTEHAICRLLQSKPVHRYVLAAASKAHQQRQHSSSLPPCCACQCWYVVLWPPGAWCALIIKTEVLVEHITHLAHTRQRSFLAVATGVQQATQQNGCPSTSTQTSWAYCSPIRFLAAAEAGYDLCRAAKEGAPIQANTPIGWFNAN